jgi:hypothetical protein
LIPSPSASTTVGQVADKLEKALEHQGYVSKAWFQVPHGFALVSRLERIDEQGKPFPGDDRWATEPVRKIACLRRYLQGLFSAPAGRFRLIVFVVTSEPFSPRGTVERGEAMEWLKTGDDLLDPATASQPFTPQHKVYALIYEFLKAGPSHKAALVDPSLLGAQAHLKSAGLLDVLRGLP